MNKILLILLSIAYSSGFVCGQIGINTEFPLGVLHVDGAHDNSSLTPTADQKLNDVIVTSAGNIGIGTTTPTVKVDLKADPSSGVSPLRIQDGSGAIANKVLESDADGAASWSPQPISVTKVYAAKPGQKFIYAVRTPLALDNDIKIPEKGKYLLTLRWWSYYRLNNSPSSKVSIYVYVLKRGTTTDLDQIEYYLLANQNQVITFATSLYLGDCNAGEIIDVVIKPQIGGFAGGAGSSVGKVHYELYGNSTRPDLMPQVILYSI